MARNWCRCIMLYFQSIGTLLAEFFSQLELLDHVSAIPLHFSAWKSGEDLRARPARRTIAHCPRRNAIDADVLPVCNRITTFWESNEDEWCGTIEYLYFLARDAFVRTNHRAIATIFVRLGRACIVIIRCTLQIWVYGWIVQCSGRPDIKACPPIPSRLFPVPPGRDVGYGCAN